MEAEEGLDVEEDVRGGWVEYCKRDWNVLYTCMESHNDTQEFVLLTNADKNEKKIEN